MEVLSGGDPGGEVLVGGLLSPALPSAVLPTTNCTMVITNVQLECALPRATGRVSLVRVTVLGQASTIHFSSSLLSPPHLSVISHFFCNVALSLVSSFLFCIIASQHTIMNYFKLRQGHFSYNKCELHICTPHHFPACCCRPSRCCCLQTSVFAPSDLTYERPVVDALAPSTWSTGLAIPVALHGRGFGLSSQNALVWASPIVDPDAELR